ncbi:MAG: hypothetical protein U5M23_05390 [Marinagarivorans sp.]|nr:hypothetical protein [Marinagarivorans sp.]
MMQVDIIINDILLSGDLKQQFYRSYLYGSFRKLLYEFIVGNENFNEKQILPSGPEARIKIKT